MGIRLGLLLASVGGLALGGGGATYTIRPAAGTRFVLTVEKTGLMSGKKHLFLFERYRGTLVYDGAAPERSRVELAIDSSSAVCQDTWVSEKDLKKIQKYALEDMLAAARYPELHFTSTAIARKDENSYEVQGMLTIRGTAKPANVMVTLHGGADSISSISGSAVVRMKDYGLKPPSAALGTIGTKSEMKVDFQLAPMRDEG